MYQPMQDGRRQDAPTSSLRPNGLQAACEPCRRRKYACDRAVPACRRCRRSRKQEHCTYVIQDSKQSFDRSSEKSSVSGQSQNGPPPADGNDPSSSDSEAEAAEPAWNFHFSLPELHGTLITVGDTADQPKFEYSLGQVDINQLRQAIDVLSSLPGPEAERILAKPHINPFNGSIPLSTTKLFNGMRRSFAIAFRQGADQGYLAGMALTLFSNTAKPFSEDVSLSDDWYASFTKTKLRWEAVGLMFSSWAFGALQNKEDIDGYQPRVLAFRFFDMMKSCISFCRSVNVNSSLLVYLFYTTSIVSTMLLGEYNAEFWDLFSQAVSLACSKKLHTLPDSTLQDPIISTQFQRRLFTTIDILDKSSGILAGRLPLLHPSYSSTALPLDISNDILLRWDSRRVPNLDSLEIDEEGWNTANEIYSTTLHRARGMIARIRGEILHIALAQESVLKGDLTKLKAEAQRVFEQFPHTLRLLDEDLSNESLEPRDLFTKLFIRLEHLQNAFIIERLICVRHPEPFNNELVEISLELISVTVTFWTRNDFLRGMEGDHQWFIIGFATPAAVVLCELLLQSRQAGIPRLSRKASDIIQHLSLLTVFIDWTTVRAPVLNPCIGVRDVIKRVLDAFLNPGLGEGDGLPGNSAAELMSSLVEIDTFRWLRKEQGVNHE